MATTSIFLIGMVAGAYAMRERMINISDDMDDDIDVIEDWC
jgi:hypothetical protein